MRSQACGISLVSDPFQHSGDDFRPAVPYQPVTPVALDLQYIGPCINGPVDLFEKIPLLHIGGHLGDYFQGTAGKLFIFGKQGIGSVTDINGIDASLFRKNKGFKNFLFGIVSPEERGHIEEITRVRPSSNEVAAHYQPADRMIPDFSGRQLPLQFPKVGMLQLNGCP